MLLKWFTENYLEANPEKYHVVLNKNNEASLKIQKLTISNSQCEKTLRIKTDYGLSIELQV